MSFPNNDFIAFCDGGSRVPFSVRECKYFPTPRNIIELLEFDNKLYYSSHSGYCVGTRLSKYVRSITAQDYKYIKEQVSALENAKQLINKTQLIMEFC